MWDSTSALGRKIQLFTVLKSIHWLEKMHVLRCRIWALFLLQHRESSAHWRPFLSLLRGWYRHNLLSLVKNLLLFFKELKHLWSLGLLWPACPGSQNSKIQMYIDETTKTHPSVRTRSQQVCAQSFHWPNLSCWMCTISHNFHPKTLLTH